MLRVGIVDLLVLLWIGVFEFDWLVDVFNGVGECFFIECCCVVVFEWFVVFGCMLVGLVYEICNFIVVMWLKVENVLVVVDGLCSEVVLILIFE